MQSPVEDNISNWGLGINESGKAESENQCPIPNWIKHTQLDKTYPIGYLEFPIGSILPNWVFSSVSPLMAWDEPLNSPVNLKKYVPFCLFCLFTKLLLFLVSPHFKQNQLI